VGREDQGLGKGESKCNESVQVYTGEQQGQTGRKLGSTRDEQGKVEAKNDGPVIPRGADGNQYLAIGDQI